MKEILVWHYGLMAERWAEFNHDAREAPYFLRRIEQYGQPVLDLACGTGRVLLPLLREGVDIDGCDISTDMLKFCCQKAKQAGFHGITVCGDYTEQPATADHVELVFTAIK